MIRIFLYIFFITLAVFSAAFSAVFADNKDAKDTKNTEGPVRITSDSARCLRQNNEDICSYFGNAKFSQGKSLLEARQITIYKSPDKVSKIVAQGKSHYNTIDTNQSGRPVNATADVITIYPDKHKMTLKGNSVIISDKDKYSGPEVDYQFGQ